MTTGAVAKTQALTKYTSTTASSAVANTGRSTNISGTGSTSLSNRGVSTYVTQSEGASGLGNRSALSYY